MKPILKKGRAAKGRTTKGRTTKGRTTKSHKRITKKGGCNCNKLNSTIKII
jgi:hypothetical protein